MTTYIHYLELPCGPLAAGAVVWVPGEQVACQQVTVPPVAARKWQAMIPWLMEDRLLQKPEDTAFSWGDKDGNNGVPVLVVSRDVLAQWQQTLAQQGQDYGALVPDFFALPWRQGAIALAVHGERWLLRSDRWRGAAGPRELLQPLVENLVADGQLTLEVYREAEQPSLGERLEAVATFIQGPNVLASPLGEWLPVAGPRRQERQTRWPLAARVAAVLAVALLALVAVTSWVETRHLDAQAAALEGQLRGAYRQYFGEDYDFPMADFQRVVSARLAAPASAGASPLVAELAAAVSSCRECRLDRLEVADGTLTALVSGPSPSPALARAVASHPHLTLDTAENGWRLTLNGEPRHE